MDCKENHEEVSRRKEKQFYNKEELVMSTYSTFVVLAQCFSRRRPLGGSQKDGGKIKTKSKNKIEIKIRLS